MAAVCEGESKIDVFLFFEDQAADDEIPPVETSYLKRVSKSRDIQGILTVLGLADEFLAIELSQECQVWSG